MKLKYFFLLACIVPAYSAYGQIEPDSAATKDFSMHADDDTFHSYGFTRHKVGDNDIPIDLFLPQRSSCCMERNAGARTYNISNCAGA